MLFSEIICTGLDKHRKTTVIYDSGI